MSLINSSINVKCDIVKPRKPLIEARPPPAKATQQKKSDQHSSKYAAVKLGEFLLFHRSANQSIFSFLFMLVLPEQSTDVGDLIQPVPGVLYEDTRLKKGDPRRYQVIKFLFFFFSYFL